LRSALQQQPANSGNLIVAADWSIRLTGCDTTPFVEADIMKKNTSNYPVGYGRPPVAHQFKPGVSGNPSGRPKRVMGLKTYVPAELAEVIRVREGDRELEILKAEAMAKSLVNDAVGGNLRATALVGRFCEPDADDTNERQGQAAETEDAEILKNYTDRELRDCTDGGDANPDTSQIDPDQNGSEDHDK
jgi:hypothetical protein